VSKCARLAPLDGARALAFLGVVTIHTVGRLGDIESGEVARFAVGASDWAVPALFMLSGYVTGRRGHTPDNVRRWIVRLGVPYVTWTLIYGGALAALGLLPRMSAFGVAAAALLGHTAAHLWFLPALMTCHVVGLVTRTPRALLAALALTVPLFVARIVVPESETVAYSLLRYSPLAWVFVYLVGVWVSRAQPSPLPASVVRAGGLVAPLVMGLTIITLGEGPMGRGLITATGLGVSWLVIADVHGGGDALALARISRFGEAAFPAYLIHMLPVYALGSVGLTGLSGWAVGAVTIGVVLLSWAVGGGLSRLKTMRWVFGDFGTR